MSVDALLPLLNSKTTGMTDFLVIECFVHVLALLRLKVGFLCRVYDFNVYFPSSSLPLFSFFWEGAECECIPYFVLHGLEC